MDRMKRAEIMWQKLERQRLASVAPLDPFSPPEVPFGQSWSSAHDGAQTGAANEHLTSHTLPPTSPRPRNSIISLPKFDPFPPLREIILTERENDSEASTEEVDADKGEGCIVFDIRDMHKPPESWWSQGQGLKQASFSDSESSSSDDSMYLDSDDDTVMSDSSSEHSDDDWHQRVPDSPRIRDMDSFDSEDEDMEDALLY